MLFVAPLVLMVSGWLREARLPPPRVPELVPSPIAFENYSRAFELVDLPRYALNSLIVAAIAVQPSVLVASWAGFATARLPRRQANALVAVSLIALMVPLRRSSSALHAFPRRRPLDFRGPALARRDAGGRTILRRMRKMEIASLNSRTR